MYVSVQRHAHRIHQRAMNVNRRKEKGEKGNGRREGYSAKGSRKHQRKMWKGKSETKREISVDTNVTLDYQRENLFIRNKA